MVFIITLLLKYIIEEIDVIIPIIINTGVIPMLTMMIGVNTIPIIWNIFEINCNDPLNLEALSFVML